MATPEEMDQIIIDMAASLASINALIMRLVTQRQTVSLNNGEVIVQVESGQVLEGETAATGPAGPMGPDGPMGPRGPTGIGGDWMPLVTGALPWIDTLGSTLVYLPDGSLVRINV
jgi:hypothetical protein